MEVGSPFLPAAPGDRTQAVRHGGSHLHLLSWAQCTAILGCVQPAPQAGHGLEAVNKNLVPKQSGGGQWAERHKLVTAGHVYMLGWQIEFLSRSKPSPPVDLAATT